MEPNAEPPQGFNVAGPGPASIIVPKIAESSRSLQGRLWNQAYDGVKAADPELAEAYEKILSTELQRQRTGTAFDASAASNDIGQTRELRAVQMQQLVQIGLKKTQREADIKQNISDGMQAIAAVKGIIDKAVQASPEAAVAWVGVCFAIEILSNPITEGGLHRSGLSYVMSRMDWYWNLAGLLLDENKAHAASAGLQEELEKHVLELYQKLIAFQIKSTCVHYQNKAYTFLRDMFQLENWSSRLQEIKDSEDAVCKDSDQFNTQQAQLYLHNIAEIASSQEGKLQDIHAAIQTQAAQQREFYEDENYKMCIKDLRDIDPRDDKTRIEQAKGGLLRDCCRWIFNDSDYLRWREEPDSKVLWIKGNPGKGKTMLLCSIINELAVSDAELSYFFCQATEAKLRNATAVLRGLIYMLVAQQPSLILHVRAKYDEAGKGLFEDGNAWQALSKILTAILADNQLGETVLFIDALDECVTDMPELIDYILAQSTSATNSVKWVITSRNWLSIEDKFLDVDGIVPLSLEKLGNDSVATAVGAFIDYKVDCLAQHKKYKPDTKAHILKYLSSNANGTFLWVALVCQDLADPKVRERHTIARLQSFPAGLEPLYKRMLAQIDEETDAEICKQILAIMTVLYRPVSLHELTCLGERLDEFEDDIEALEEIISICGSFLYLRGGVVSFIHQSAKDFLQKEDSVVPAKGTCELHCNVFLQSLEALSKTLRRDIYDLAAPGILVESILTPTPDPLRTVRYACVYLVDHLEGSKRALDNLGDELHLGDGGPLDGFLRSKYLHWLEALSLLRSIAQGCAAMNKLEALLAGTQSSQLIALVSDASRFLLTHRTIVETAPLQIYVSALLFSPTQSAVRMLYNDHIPAWVTKAPAVPKTWGSVVQTLDGHRGWVQGIAQAPVKRLLASASDDSEVKIWDLVSGLCLHTLGGHNLVTTSLRFPTIEESKHLPEEMQHGGPVPFEVRNAANCVHISADETLLAYGLADGTVWVWNLPESGKPSNLCTLEAEWGDDAPKSVGCVSLSNSGKLVSVLKGEDAIKIWDVEAVLCIRTIQGHGQQGTKAVISTDGARVASCSRGGSLRLWCFNTGKCLLTLSDVPGPYMDVEFSPDGRWLASATGDTTIKLWDSVTGTCVRSFDGGTDGYFTALAFRPDGSQLVSASMHGNFQIWDLATGGRSEPQSILYPRTASSVALSCDGRRLVAVDGSDKGPIIFDTTSTETYVEKNNYFALGCIAVLRTRGLVACCGSYALGAYRIYDLSTAKCLCAGWMFPGMFRDWEIDVLMAFSENGRWLAATELPTGDTMFLDLKGDGGRSETAIRSRGTLVDCAFSPDSRWFVTASENTEHVVQVWDVENRDSEMSLERSFAAAPGPSGETVVRCENGYWGEGDDRPLTQYALRTIAFSTETGLMAVGCSSRSYEEHIMCNYDGNYCKGYKDDKPEPFAVLVLDIVAGVCIRVLNGHQAPVGRVAFSDDGSRIASIDSCKQVRVWDAGTGECVNWFKVESFIRNLDFCPGSSSRLLTEHGLINLPVTDTNDLEGRLPVASYHGYRAHDGWIWNGKERVLKLPAGYDAGVGRGNSVLPNTATGSATVFCSTPRTQLDWFEFADDDSSL